MEMYSRAGITSLRCQCGIILRALPKIFAFPTSLQKTIQKIDEYVHRPLMKESMVNGESAELLEEILMDIFALLEIPDFVRVGSVCSSWRAAYISLCSPGMYRQPQTPCLLYTSEADDDNIACLYSLAEKRVYKLTLPEPPILVVILLGPPKAGWLLPMRRLSCTSSIRSPVSRSPSRP
uniref:F-box domain-containing protein n=1 Tax=Arundo donax TaxID=35708 RepID=A0A0A9CU39_ARUDO